MVKKILIVFLLAVLSVSCGSRKKVLQKTEEKKQEQIAVKKDSIFSSEIKKEEEKIIVSESNDYEFEIKPTVNAVVADTTKNQKNITENRKNVTRKVKIKTPDGKTTEAEYPADSDFKFSSKNSKKTETENNKETGKQEGQVKSDEKKSTKIDNSKKDLDVDKKEPISFNLPFALGICAVVLILLYLILKRFNIIK